MVLSAGEDRKRVVPDGISGDRNSVQWKVWLVVSGYAATCFSSRLVSFRLNPPPPRSLRWLGQPADLGTGGGQTEHGSQLLQAIFPIPPLIAGQLGRHDQF